MNIWTFTLFSLSTILLSASVLEIFPKQCSQYFYDNLKSKEVLLPEAVLREENHGTFSISLWMKLIDITKSGTIFTMKIAEEEYIYSPSLIYYKSSPMRYLNFSATQKSQTYEPFSLSIAPSDNWIFVAVSLSYENKSILLYYNNKGVESHITGILDLGISLNFESSITFEGPATFNGAISDFRIYNNIYNQVSDWSFQYLSSCAAETCSSLSASVSYGKCDYLCASQTEWFFPAFLPALYSATPYIEISDKAYSNVGRTINVPNSEWNDYSVTGWAQFSDCQEKIGTFFYLHDNWEENLLSIQLINSTNTSHCDMLEATIWSTDGIDIANDTATIISSSYIGNWFFFAVTVNSGSKLLTLYSQNGANPPSTSDPLISSSITYTYVAKAYSYEKSTLIGGKGIEIYKGNYADFRIYPGSSIDTILTQYNCNLYSAATYLDPHCTSWSSIWYCSTCETGYFIKNGLCQKCHPSCAACSSEDTETDCLSCASGYYSQPGHPSMCLNYCPLGYTWNFPLKQCTGAKGTIANINFDNNLSGNFIFSNLYLILGISSDDYYPEFEFLDPLPANKRGLFLSQGIINFEPQSSNQAGRLFSSEFTLEAWIIVKSSGCFYLSKSYYEDLYGLNKSKWLLKFGINRNGSLELFIERDDKYIQEYYSPQWLNSGNSPEWAFYSISFKYDDIAKSTEILLVKNTNLFTAAMPNYNKEFPGITHTVGSVGYGQSIFGFLYSLAMYNYGKNYNELKMSLGACDSCSACPAVLKSCLPTCGETEYVDENGNCQKCPSECSWICSRAGTCNLCYDDLCYKCTKYEIGTCIKCVENAVLSSGQCECQSGYIKQESQCVEKCSDGFYLDESTQSCISCLSNCSKCSNVESCTICKTGFIERNGKCECSDGHFLDSSNNCSKCDISCLTCSIDSSNCLSCTGDLPIVFNKKCYPCEAFEGFSDLFSVPISYFTDDLWSRLSSKCIETCGDGRNMGQAQCDDGNNKNGDGCSENCTIETGWTCSGGSISSPDICKDIILPWPFLAYLSENDSGYLLALSFSEKVNMTSDLSENIKITIDGIEMFSWAISLEKSIYEVTLNLYESVESGTGVTINFINPSEITDTSGNQMKEKKVKSILLAPFTYKTAEAMETSVTTATTVAAAGAAAGSIFTGSFNLQAFWSMLEIMQIQNYLIFLSPKYPNNLITYLRALSIANGNFLPNPFQLYLVKNDPFPDPPQKFADENFNTDFLMNAGQFVAVWAIILTGLPICIILYKIRPSLPIIRWLNNSFFYAILLRTGIESFLEITLSVLLQLRECSQPNQDIGYLSLILSFLTILYLVSTFALIVWQVTLKPKGLLGTKLHERRFGVLYQGFKRDSKLKASFLLFQNIRRVLLLIFCVFLYEHTTAQVLLSASLSLTYTVLLIVLKPYEQRYLGNFLNTICEILYFAAHCIILKFLDNHISDDYRTNLGWAIIALLSTYLLLHIVCLLIIQITNLIQGVKQLKNWFLQNFANKFLKAKRRIFMNEIESSDLNKEVSKELKAEEICEEKVSRIHTDGNFLNIDTSGDSYS